MFLRLLITTTQLLVIEVGEEERESTNTSLNVLRLTPEELGLFFQGFIHS